MKRTRRNRKHRNDQETERLKQLLAHLRRGTDLSEVPGNLLQEPRSGTRPGVQPVVHYTTVWQEVLQGRTPSELLAGGVPAVVILSGIGWTGWRGLQVFENNLADWQLTGYEFLFIVVLLTLVLYTYALLARTQDDLWLDLNEISFATPSHRHFIAWQYVYGVSAFERSRLRVQIENGLVVALSVPKAHRDLLVDIMNELVSRYRRDTGRAGMVCPPALETPDDQVPAAK